MPEDKGLSRSQREEKVLQFWKDNQIFKKTLEKDSPKGEFVFYEGPPTANGRPAIHHLPARAFKDAIPRYKTMRGYKVPRKAGWDTHGLPVELEVEKELGLKSKKEIEGYGVAKFNKACKRSVWKYVDEWQKYTDRIGYWVDLDHPYVTYHNKYIEAVWSIVSHIDKRDLLYKDYKVVPWCPRCGTALSSHELAQGYTDVKDISLYVKFRVKGQDNTYLVAWTTTPWTLPGNVALAVGEDIKYTKYKVGNEFYIVAKDRAEKMQGEVVEEFMGKDLVGLEYEPLYDFSPKNENSHKVYPADFVTTEDGTGIVHTAVMYGQEDFELGHKVGLPKQHLVDEAGYFKSDAGDLSGKSVVEESTAVEILKDLQARGLLFDKESYTHSYPFCWRCKTRLIYYARDSWYIRMSELRDKLVKENEKIHWEPEHIKEGRFGEWLREVKDWAISRERYWGTPLPIWQSESGKRLVIDSLETIKKYSKPSHNKYLVMRHGGTNGNKTDRVSYKKEAEDHLTEEGREGVEKSAKHLKNVDLIISSPFTRARETAEIVAEKIGYKKEDIVYDQRIQEIDPGGFDGGDWFKYHEAQKDIKDWFDHAPEGGESLAEVRKRVGGFLYELDNKYDGKNILVVTHGGPAWLMYVVSGEYDPSGEVYQMPERSKDTKIFVKDFQRFQNAEVRELPFIRLPHNENFELDLHKPYIDEVVLVKGGEEYRRVKEVMDVWFDSGAVPFAQNAEEREEAGNFKHIRYPADYISEGIDQTRGWFYTMHAIGVLLDKGKAFLNVICLGLIMDKDGKKMSKSVGNVVDPWEEMDKYGADVLRMWMYSVNQPGESKNYDPLTVSEVEKKVFNLLDNVYSFYELYRDRSLEKVDSFESKNILDKWIVSKLHELTKLMTVKLDEYKLLEPSRGLRDFIDDLSTWYLRRSRERIKDGDMEAKRTLYIVLKTLSKLISPLAPFAAEDLYQKLRTETESLSVHLEEWPEGGKIEENILKDMEVIRSIVSIALEQRSKSNIKVRQPLNQLVIKNNDLGMEYLEIIRDELNVKQVIQDKNLEQDVWLDTKMTEALLEEGKVRDVIRSIQDMRKEKGLKPSDVLHYEIPEAEKTLFEKHGEVIRKATNID